MFGKFFFVKQILCKFYASTFAKFGNKESSEKNVKKSIKLSEEISDS